MASKMRRKNTKSYLVSFTLKGKDTNFTITHRLRNSNDLKNYLLDVIFRLDELDLEMNKKVKNAR